MAQQDYKNPIHNQTIYIYGYTSIQPIFQPVPYPNPTQSNPTQIYLGHKNLVQTNPCFQVPNAQ